MSYDSCDSGSYLAAVVAWGLWCFCFYADSSFSDSIGAISITRDPAKHELTKHIGVDAHFTQSQVQDGVVALQYMPSEFQLTDFFTKAQTHVYHQFYLSKLSVVDPPWVWGGY
jgi:hypothetical protein